MNGAGITLGHGRSDMDYDAIVVGAGPAGLTAATDLALAEYRVLLLDRDSFGGQAMNVEWIESYPGRGERIEGPMLGSEMVTRAAGQGVQMELGDVVGVGTVAGRRAVTCAGGEVYTSSVLVLAGGVRSRPLGIPGELALEGKGIIHCAFCDASLYEDRVVAVCGGGDAGTLEALFLARHAAKVLLIEAQARLSAKPALQKRARAEPRLDIRCGRTVVAVSGRDSVTGIDVHDAASGRTESLEVDGVLVRAGFEPMTGYLEGTLPLDDRGYVEVDGESQTRVAGILAAGDIRRGSPRNVAAAVRDGRVAAASARRTLEAAK